MPYSLCNHNNSYEAFLPGTYSLSLSPYRNPGSPCFPLLCPLLPLVLSGINSDCCYLRTDLSHPMYVYYLYPTTKISTPFGWKTFLIPLQRSRHLAWYWLLIRIRTQVQVKVTSPSLPSTSSLLHGCLFAVPILLSPPNWVERSVCSQSRCFFPSTLL